MKKALALVLAFVLALSLGVSAFALELVKLDTVPETPASKIPVTNVLLRDTKVDTVGVTYLAPAAGGDFYFSIEDYANLKKISVSTTGSVSAEIVKFDGSKMKMAGVNYFVVDTKGEVKDTSATQAPWAGEADINYYLGLAAENEDYANAEDWSVYETAAKYAKLMNSKAKVSGRFVVKAYEGLNEVELNLLKVTVAPNYSAAYKTGSFKVTATTKDTKEAVVYSANVVTDVTIFEYEMVKWAGEYEEALVVGDEGYSDYYFDGKYSKNGDEYDYSELREEGSYATVLSTTEFRVLRENKWGINVEAGDMLVTIPEVVSGQKGVNFAYYGVDYNSDKKAVQFGFYGDQTIASDFTITLTVKNAYQLREFFKEKVEEEDIITYYVVKDGKVLESFTIDYMKDDIDTPLELVIKGKAGSTLGQYEIVLEAPTAATEGEENPNTGAESVIGVVAAMAVVSVAAAAAVSLKK